MDSLLLDTALFDFMLLASKIKEGVTRREPRFAPVSNISNNITTASILIRVSPFGLGRGNCEIIVPVVLLKSCHTLSLLSTTMMVGGNERPATLRLKRKGRGWLLMAKRGYVWAGTRHACKCYMCH